MKLAALLPLVAILGSSSLANAGWYCTAAGGGTITLDQVTISGHATTPTWSASTTGNQDMGCSNDASFTFNWPLTTVGSKEAHALAVAAFLANLPICVYSTSCNAGGYALVTDIQINR